MALDPNILEDHKMAGLPMMVATPVDVGRLIRELEQLDDKLSQAQLRKEEKPKLPRTSQLMDQTLQLNKLDALEAADRQRLAVFLETVKGQAPVLHFSFSADPSTAFIEKLVTWLRREIHPLVLVSIGLQPNIGAGCIVRSTNKYFDLSLRQDFSKKRDLLKEALAPATAPQEVAA